MAGCAVFCISVRALTMAVMAASTCATSVVGTAAQATPRRYVAATKPATSPVVRPVLAADLPAGAGVSELPVEPLPGSMRAGHRLVLPTGQVAVVRADAERGGTALPIVEIAPSAPVPAGTALPQEVVIAVGKTPAGFTVRRLDDGASASYEDTTWSGGYLFLRNDRDDVAAISCADLTVEGGGAE